MKLYRKATKEMPFLYFYKGQINLKGKSIPFHKCDISDILKGYMNNYSKSPDPVTEINFDLDYINCQTQRNLVQTVQIIDELYKNGINVKIRWYYDSYDDNMLEFGNILQSMFEVPIDCVEKELVYHA